MEQKKLTAGDLMVGDWIQCPTIQEKYAKITEIYLTLDAEPKRMVSLNSYGLRYCVPIDEIEPIPFTKDLLKKNAVYSEKEDNYSIDILTFETDGDEIEMGITYIGLHGDLFYSIIDIKYVHELQHALKVCHINKEVTIR